jgi:hypothetical protein
MADLLDDLADLTGTTARLYSQQEYGGLPARSSPGEPPSFRRQPVAMSGLAATIQRY